MEITLQIHSGKNATVDETLKKSGKELLNLWPVSSDPHTDQWHHKEK